MSIVDTIIADLKIQCLESDDPNTAHELDGLHTDGWRETMRDCVEFRAIVAHIAIDLVRAQAVLRTTHEQDVDVHLQVVPAETLHGCVWSVHTGDPGYDLDHHGHWAAGYLTRDMSGREVKALAWDLWYEVWEDMCDSE